MRIPVGTRTQFYVLLVSGALLVFVLVRWRSGPSAPSAVAGRGAPASRAAGPLEEERPGPRGPARANEKVITADEVPIVTTKDFDSQRDRREGPTERNLFDLRPPTPRPLPTPTAAPPPPPRPGEAAFVGPLPPPPPTPTPAPPDIPFKFIGTFGPRDRSFAVLVLGDQIVNARAGEVVFDRFILRRVGYESVDVGFVGFAPTETRRLGIAP